MTTCSYCENNTPHLHYYLNHHVPKFSSFEEAYEDTKKNMEDYHNGHGKFGFLSEHTDEDYLSENNILSRSRHVWESDQNCIYDAKKASCLNISELAYLKNSPGFVEFL